MHALASLVSLSDRELVDRLDRVAERDHATNAEVVAHLVLIEDRRIHLDWGYPSLFVYCTERLRFSEDCSYKRIQAARAAARCPKILEYLADGELTLSTVKLLAPHIEKPEGPELVEEAREKSKREVERLVAARFPDPGRPRGSSFRVRPIDAESYKVEMTVDAEFLELLERAACLDRHRNPEGDRVKILKEGLERHIAAAEKRKYKVTDKPRAPKPGPTDSVPAEVSRGVHERDQGRCTWVGEDGRRCNATAWIEHDHITPRAKGGEHSVENGREQCRQHNLRSAELEFGRSKVPRAQRASSAPAWQAKEPGPESEMQSDALSALRELGFKDREAKRALASAQGETLEELLRSALAILGRSPYVTKPQGGTSRAKEAAFSWGALSRSAAMAPWCPGP